MIKRLKEWLIQKLGGEIPEPKMFSYRITEVYKTGEKLPIDVKRGIKPQGYNIYGDGMFIKFLPLKQTGAKLK